MQSEIASRKSIIIILSACAITSVYTAIGKLLNLPWLQSYFAIMATYLTSGIYAVYRSKSLTDDVGSRTLAGVGLSNFVLLILFKDLVQIGSSVATIVAIVGIIHIQRVSGSRR